VIVSMRADATAKQTGAVLTAIAERGWAPHVSKAEGRTVIAVVGAKEEEGTRALAALPGVERVSPFTRPYRLASRDFRSADTVVEVNGVEIGGKALAIVAGPCAVESREQLEAAAAAVAAAGVQLLRGGAFKPRTSPYSFRGLGEEGLKLLREVADRHGMAVVTEVLSPRDVALVAARADVLQIGTRNMQNFDLLEAVGEADRPVLLKRGMSATIEELLMAADYVLARGNGRVILCERGIRTFERSTRNTLDVAAIPVLKHLSHLPVLADPSHATGVRRYVPAAARAAVAAGADGLLVEVHPDPDRALSDGPQSLDPAGFARLVEECRAVAAAVGRA
jgi:3-deoxy-7-phosphoheptulonate synthase